MRCPLCAHEQDFGLECEVCGRALGGLDALGPPPVQAQSLEGLERTGFDDVGQVVSAAMPDMEPTLAPEVMAPPAAPVPDLDTGRAEAVPEVPGERVPIDDERGPGLGAPTPLTAVRACRYCRNPQPTGAFCDVCGMALGPVAATPTPAVALTETWTNCPACGARAKALERCGDCGWPVPLPEA